MFCRMLRLDRLGGILGLFGRRSGLLGLGYFVGRGRREGT